MFSLDYCVKKIEAKALSSKKVTKVSLSSKNKIYKMANNCIYRKSDGLLVGVIAKTKKVSIPSKVKVIDDTVSVMGKIGSAVNSLPLYSLTITGGFIP